MSVEPVTQAAPAAAEEKQDNKKNGKDRKRDETPIEELFDLSQPIPKVSCCPSPLFDPIAKDRN